jgi:hypothetical protein
MTPRVDVVGGHRDMGVAAGPLASAWVDLACGGLPVGMA